MKKFIAGLVALLVPSLAFAQQLQNLSILVASATHILNQLIPFAIALGVVVFLFGVVRYVTAGEGEEKAAARNLMIYGIIAIFVMVSVWGLVGFLGSALGIAQGGSAAAPNVPVNSSGGY